MYGVQVIALMDFVKDYYYRHRHLRNVTDKSIADVLY